MESLKKSNVAPQDWTLGGGTALMLHHQHRMSQDIDIFIDDAQYLAFLPPTTWTASVADSGKT
ncbi:nucleotidyl transferase AbiEii/AbiGii toxin family protein [Rhizobium sp. LjRoot258]|uniref:nucleotidyl transferase AbiEii/AbiGii toxin family protein n=1 Tax=Rhizobium sp. LjRoot258 TaxID=3342299 RepID=UPI003ECE12D0